jgi:ribonuclease HII
MTGASKRGRRPVVYHGVELRCGSQFENEAREAGHAVVAGVDEVGRGALCGPVVAAAVVLGDSFDPDGLDDSKRLTARQRERAAQRIRAGAAGWALGVAEPAEIDAVNILQATLVAMRRAVLALPVRPDLLLVDALMAELDLCHPGYDLARNMGYGCQQHRDALRRIGPSPIHRRSFNGTQPWLFT